MPVKTSKTTTRKPSSTVKKTSTRKPSSTVKKTSTRKPSSTTSTLTKLRKQTIKSSGGKKTA